jgi:hypothetical protein
MEVENAVINDGGSLAHKYKTRSTLSSRGMQSIVRLC